MRLILADIFIYIYIYIYTCVYRPSATRCVAFNEAKVPVNESKLSGHRRAGGQAGARAAGGWAGKRAGRR